MTLDDLERPKRLSCRNKQSFRRSPEKVDRFILLAEKCRPKILVARNISYMRICAGFHRGGGVKCKRHADVHRDVFILGTRRCGLLAAQLLAVSVHNQHPIILDQCAECDLL